MDVNKKNNNNIILQLDLFIVKNYKLNEVSQD